MPDAPPKRDAHERGPNGGWIRPAHRPPVKRKQISVRLPLEVQDEAEKVAMELSARPPFAEVTVSDLIRWGLEHVLKEYRPERRTNRPCITTSRGNGALGHIMSHLCIVCGSTDPEVCKYDE